MGNRRPAMIGFAAGLLILYLAVPRVQSAVDMLDAGVAIFTIERGGTPSGEALTHAILSLQAALAHGVDAGTLHSQKSFLAFHQVNLRSSSTREERSIARTYVIRALERRPLDAYLWTRFVHINFVLDGLSPETLSALEKSFLYGSNEFELAKFRLLLCLSVWEDLPPVLQDRTRQEAILVAKTTYTQQLVTRQMTDQQLSLFQELVKNEDEQAQ